MIAIGEEKKREKGDDMEVLGGSVGGGLCARSGSAVTG